MYEYLVKQSITESELNELGFEDWELVSTVINNGEGEYVFKRKKEYDRLYSKCTICGEKSKRNSYQNFGGYLLNQEFTCIKGHKTKS